MTTQLVPAEPGTVILEIDRTKREARVIPVMAYAWVAGGVVFPLSVLAHGGLTRGRVLALPTGMVVEASLGMVYSTVEEWMKHADTDEYWTAPHAPKNLLDQPGTEKFAAAGGTDGAGISRAEPKPNISTGGPREDPEDGTLSANEMPDDLPTTPPGKTAEVKTFPGSRVIPDKPKRTREPRVFKTNSYWQYCRTPGKFDPAWDCVWMIPGGQVVPFEDDPDFSKITGEQFKAAKKAGWPENDPRAADTDDDLEGVI